VMYGSLMDSIFEEYAIRLRSIGETRDPGMPAIAQAGLTARRLAWP